VSLRDWQANRWLVEHRTTPQEIADLLAVADRDLADCKVTGLKRGRALEPRIQWGLADRNGRLGRLWLPRDTR